MAGGYIRIAYDTTTPKLLLNENEGLVVAYVLTEIDEYIDEVIKKPVLIDIDSSADWKTSSGASASLIDYHEFIGYTTLGSFITISTYSVYFECLHDINGKNYFGIYFVSGGIS